MVSLQAMHGWHLAYCFLFLASICGSTFKEKHGYARPQMKWNFNSNPENGSIKEARISNSAGYLLPGTSIQRIANMKTRVIHFNGNNSGLIIDNITMDCFAQPVSCKKGLSLSFWLNIVEWNNESIILSSSNVEIIPTINGNFGIRIWNGSHEWRRSFKPKANVWECFVFTWDAKVLKTYRNGNMKGPASSKIVQKRTSQSTGEKALKRRMVIGNTAEKQVRADAVKMYMDTLQIWDEYVLQANEISSVCQQDKDQDLSASTDSTAQLYQIYTSLEYTDKALMGHTFQSSMVSDVDECIQRCMDNRNHCKSFNYERANGLSLCELNDVEAANSEIFIQHRINFQFYKVYWMDAA